MRGITMIARCMKGLVCAAALLTAAAATVHADPVGGDVRHRDRVLANDTDSYVVALRGNETTRITLRGDGDTCLELRVYDEHGHLVGADSLGWGDHRQVLVTPRWTGRFRVTIRNIGPVYNDYLLLMD